MSLAIRDMTNAICHMAYVICHLSFVLCHLSFVICHLSFVICLLRLHSVVSWEMTSICQLSFVITVWSQLLSDSSSVERNSMKSITFRYFELCKNNTICMTNALCRGHYKHDAIWRWFLSESRWYAIFKLSPTYS